MRSVFLYFWGTNEESMAATLSVTYPTQSHPWVCFVKEDPCLYIDFYRDGPKEADDWGTRFASKGGPPTVSVGVDVSGRHEGWPEVQEFVVWLLGLFPGMAEDEMGARLWTRDEIKEDRVIDGMKFGHWRH